MAAAAAVLAGHLVRAAMEVVVPLAAPQQAQMVSIRPVMAAVGAAPAMCMVLWARACRRARQRVALGAAAEPPLVAPSAMAVEVARAGTARWSQARSRVLRFSA